MLPAGPVAAVSVTLAIAGPEPESAISRAKAWRLFSIVSPAGVFDPATAIMSRKRLACGSSGMFDRIEAGGERFA
jgi:hypothetical protein